MDEHALRVLEYDKVIDRLAKLTSFAGGRDLALALQPSPDFDEVLRRQRLLAEAIRLRRLRTPLNLTSASDVRPAVEKAALGGVLDTHQLLEIANTQQVAETVRAATARHESDMPLLWGLGQSIVELRNLVAEILKAIDQRGEVLASASPNLGLIRRDIRIAHDRLHSKLQEFLASPAGRLAAQEPIVTLRDGRYVIPIKADFRGEVRGIVHDVSSSGATLFIEPLAVVDLANKWRELQIEEQREVERILRRLSALAGENAAVLKANVGVLAQVDLVMAAARLADELTPHDRTSLPDAAPPERWLLSFKDGAAALELREARHPLLSAPVPISISIGGADRVLLITGPNTGGKTVALKTVGLLVLMAQSGLPVPAEGASRIPVFEDVLADIGDEQSIEQSLSTFSGHIKNIIGLLQRAGPTSLVLLDELAAGTDPAEGAALARALLRHLIERGALTIATTHHGELKLFAHSTPGVRNAAVEFNPVTLAPTYRITIGVPGRSNALAIAARLGLPEAILKDAQASLSPEQAEIDALLDDLRREREAAAAARQQEEQARRRAEEARARAEQRLAAIDEQRAERLEEAATALEEEVDAAREALARAQRTLQRLHAAGAPPRDLEEARQAVAEASETAKRIRRRSRRRRRPHTLGPQDIRPGYQVWLRGVPTPAEALSEPDRRGELDVTLGSLRARVRVDQVVRVEKAAPVKLQPSALPAPPPSFAEQIEVRGQTLDEALPRVEQFLDLAFRAGAPRLRVVHGKGTGRMRQAVREMLARHPLVKDFGFAPPNEGGEGVTVVEMALS
ncbi:MAG TPA: endonuclease MutS2 [Dehalococcoidia bacterium]|nr:endonuclease MutS2 [Dehalococcoidia bacterium]